MLSFPQVLSATLSPSTDFLVSSIVKPCKWESRISFFYLSNDLGQQNVSSFDREKVNVNYGFWDSNGRQWLSGSETSNWCQWQSRKANNRLTLFWLVDQCQSKFARLFVSHLLSPPSIWQVIHLSTYPPTHYPTDHFFFDQTSAVQIRWHPDGSVVELECFLCRLLHDLLVAWFASHGGLSPLLSSSSRQTCCH